MGADGSSVWSVDVSVTLADHTLNLTMSAESRTVAVVGPSGAGKSTLLRVLAGVERSAVGKVVVDGVDWLDSEAGTFVPPWNRSVGWVPQDASLFPHLTVRENLGYAGAPEEEIDKVAALTETLALLDRRPRRLSGGERQRVALGRALLAAPTLLLLDEPLSALERPLRAKLAREVRGWASKRGVALVLVSHDEQDTDILADEHWHLSSGVLSRAARPPEPDSPA